MNNVNDDVGKSFPPPDNSNTLNGAPAQISAPQRASGVEKIPKIPPAAAQGWYKKCICDEDIKTLSNAKIYSIVANNPLQKPNEIQKPATGKKEPYTPAPITNPMPQRTRMYTYQRPYAPSTMRYS